MVQRLYWRQRRAAAIVADACVLHRDLLLHRTVDRLFFVGEARSHHSTSRHLKARRIIMVPVLLPVGNDRVHFAYLNLILTSHVATVEKSMHT